jgi:hypothetical protein
MMEVDELITSKMGSIISRQAPSMNVALQNVKDIRVMANNILPNQERELSDEKLKKIVVDIEEYIELFKDLR